MRALLVMLAACGTSPAPVPEPAPEPSPEPAVPAAFIALHTPESGAIVEAVFRWHEPAKLLPPGSFVGRYVYDGSVVPAVRARVDELAAIDTDRRILFVFDPRWDYSADAQRDVLALRSYIDQVGVGVVTLREMACIDGGPMGASEGAFGVDVKVTTYEVSEPAIGAALLP